MEKLQVVVEIASGDYNLTFDWDGIDEIEVCENTGALVLSLPNGKTARLDADTWTCWYLQYADAADTQEEDPDAFYS
jgi:hypothetical protein